ncbi:transglycosylase domain-containing protein [Actinomycetes bacterium KLBMP 9759]
MGWWQTPKRRSDEPARHRAQEATEPIPVIAPNRRRWARAPRSRPALSPAHQRARRRRTLVRTVLWSAGSAVLAPVLAFTLGYLFLEVPSPDDAVDNQVATVAFTDGSPLTRLVPESGNRTKVAIEAVPQVVRDAVLAAEDRSFYSNPGFDLTGIARAVWNQLRGGQGGGSTITQQYVKKALVGDEQTLWRKFKEVVLAVKVSQERTKDEILGDYLNTIYFGRGAYGIQAASQAYFGKNVEQLAPSDAALLAGVIQSPSRWDPAVSPERAVQRWTFVLDGMVAQGRLTPQERKDVRFPPTVPRKPTAGGVPADSNGHIVTAVTRELEDLGITEQVLAQGGLQITTTIDPLRQRQAVEAAHDALTGQPVNLRSSLVAIDPATGGVLAYYGGDNGHGLDYARAPRLAGSTFKPFVVLAGLQRDPPVGLGKTFDGTEMPGLRNADGADCGRCDLKQAMTISNNVVFNTLAKQVGPEAVADAARLAGIRSPLDDPTEGIALGNKEVTTFEMASAYATLAAGGVWREPHLVSSIVTADGVVLYEADTRGERRFEERVARNVTETMLDVAERDGLALPGGRPVAAKTGTVESRFEGENNDAWMAGYTPLVSTSVWMGTDMNTPIRTAAGRPITGKSLPGEAWKEFMIEVHDDLPVEQFAPFRPIGEAPVRDEPARPSATAAPGPSGEPASTGAPPTGGPPSQRSAPATTVSASASAEPTPTGEAGDGDEETRQPERSSSEGQDCTVANPCG